MNFVISQIATFLPGPPVTNLDIISKHSLKMKADWVENRLGIVTRHWAEPGCTASDLAVNACKKLDLKNFSGPIWVSTISPDHFSPSTSVIVKRKLGLKDSFPTFDVNNACAGFLFALESARSWLETHEDSKEALVIATELRSKFLDKSDRRTVFLFGDGAVAVKLTKGAAQGGIDWVDVFSIYSDFDEIFVPLDSQKITMADGHKISEMATNALADKLQSILIEKKIKISDFDLVLSHQANQQINQKLFDLLQVKPEQIFSNLNKTGNCSSASIGIALDEAVKTGKLKDGHKILMITMGAGYHFAAATITWEELT
ncbi:MAG: ketoacyl-ACP synthase III [Oligoflexia bacterium]|nr:ketoacyl-ACP synthase III [Oligoflexia bacterium]